MMIKKKFIISGIFILFLFGFIVGFKVKDVLSSPDDYFAQFNKFASVMKMIGNYYVDDVKWSKVYAGAIKGALSELDPHSTYIPARELKVVTENMEGSFEGIGISFDIVDNAIMVVSPIAGGPSDKLGIRAGDRIVKINGVSTYGITTEEVMRKLKGPKGTTVNVTIVREGIKNPLEYTITRDKIPLHTIQTSFVNENKIGYIDISQFARTTTDEFQKAMSDLLQQGMQKLVLDLRGNPGGYEDQAVNLASSFIGDKKRIVYNRGRASGTDNDFYARVKAEYPDIPLIVLVDRGSASASEIFAGAIQDWDRGLIVGQRTFGKGLVQHQYQLADTSAVRITVARYYTPSGRSIQRPFNDKTLEQYYHEVSEDSVPAIPDSVKQKYSFRTSGGRLVFGAGGIEPDMAVKYAPITKSDLPRTLAGNLFLEFCTEFANKNRELGRDYNTFTKTFTVSDAMFKDFKNFVKSKNPKFEIDKIDKDLDFVKLQLKAQIARSLWGNEKYYQTIVLLDNQYLESLKLFDKAIEVSQLKPVVDLTK